MKRKERRKRQRSLKKKSRLIVRQKTMTEMIATINEMKGQCSASQSAVNSSQKNVKLLERKIQTLKEKYAMKSNFVREVKEDQLSVVKDSHDNEIVLGQGRFGICKLMSLAVSGESVRVAVKHYNQLTSKEAVVQEASLLAQISHPAFPFVFGVVLGETHNMLVLEVCGVSERGVHPLTIFRALQSVEVCITEKSWFQILMQCCQGFYCLHSKGIVHNDIKGDNILIALSSSGVWQPKIIDFNKACQIKDTKVKNIPVNERARYKSCHKHIDPALYEGEYVTGPASDVYSFGYMASKIAKHLKSDLIERLAMTCMSRYKRPAFEVLIRDIEAITNV